MGHNDILMETSVMVSIGLLFLFFFAGLICPKLL